jgi:8-oxo-dGTP diphosphatase
MTNSIHSATKCPQPSIGVGGILFNRGGDVLLIRRGQPPREGYWSIPGGKLEPGENLATACTREFFEETGLKVSIDRIVAVAERKLEGFHYVIVDFLVCLNDENANYPVAQSDVLEACWLHPADFCRYPLVEGLADIIHRAYDCLDSGGGLSASGNLSCDYILPQNNS